MAKALEHDASPQAWARMWEWQHIWLRTIARAWADDGFRQRLLTDAKGAINEAFGAEGYQLPDKLTLRVKESAIEPGAGKWTRSAQHKGKEHVPFDHLENTEVTLILPKKPRAQAQAIALADYGDAGRTYPFTTC